MSNRTYRYVLVAVAAVLGLFALATPKAKDKENHFSAERAFADIEVIAQVPHTVEDHEALEDVREYLITRMTELNLNPIVNNYAQEDEEYNMSEVNNILGVLEGNSDSYILLLAHYDSSPGKRSGEEDGSLGAADDGYGLSTILEVVNIIQNNDITLENGIKVLFTDGEEVGLYGAEKEVEMNPEFFEDVALVINIEARGVKGPVVMFETSANNLDIMKFYAKANYPVSFSLAGDVYSRMPNSTDFTPLNNHGIPGINMAVLDNLDYYHTPEDNPDNVNLSSLQHYGEVNYSLVEEFVSNDKYSDVNYFENSQNAMYFTLLPNIFFVYSATTQIVLVILTLLIVIFNVYVAIKNQEVNIKRLPKCVGVWTAAMLLLLVDGILVSLILGWIFGVPFSVTYMPNVGFALGFFIIMTLLYTGFIGYVVYRFVKAKENHHSLLYGGFIFIALFMLIFLLVLPGGVYMFMIPLLVSNFVIHIIYLLKRYQKGNDRIYRAIESINIVIPVMLFAPVLYLLYIALTIGAMGIIALFLIFPLAIIFPTIERLER